MYVNEAAEIESHFCILTWDAGSAICKVYFFGMNATVDQGLINRLSPQSRSRSPETES